MKPGKKILRSKLFQQVACWLAHKYILFVYYTTRWEIRGGEYMGQIEVSGKPCIFAFWHGRLLLVPPFAPKFPKTHVLISNHNDGELIARTMTNFGFELVRGSTNKAGVSALRNILRIAKKNESIVITPDGPRGPRMRVTGTIAEIAQATGLPVLPVSYSTSRCKILRSWDRFMLVKPFGRGVFIYDAPIVFDRKWDETAVKKAGILLETRLNIITKEADMAVGLTPVEPDDISR